MIDKTKVCPICKANPRRYVISDRLIIECQNCKEMRAAANVRFGCLADDLWEDKVENIEQEQAPKYETIKIKIKPYENHTGQIYLSNCEDSFNENIRWNGPEQEIEIKVYKNKKDD